MTSFRFRKLAYQIACTITQREIAGIINCCTGRPVSLKDKVEEFIAEKGFAITPQYGAFPDRPYDSPAIWGNADKIQRIVKAAGTETVAQYYGMR